MQKFLPKQVRRNVRTRKSQSYHLRCNHINTDTSTRSTHASSNLIFPLPIFGSNSELPSSEPSQKLHFGTKPDSHALFFLLRDSKNLGCISCGQQLHCYILRSGFGSNPLISTALISLYVKFELSSDAHQVFVEIPQPSVVSWNCIISGHVQCGHFSKALGLFLQLNRSEISADPYSFTAALSACGQVSLLQLGTSIHSKIVKFGCECSIFIANCLIDMYGKCGSVKDAIQVFFDMVDKDAISWNSVISACARNQELPQAFQFLREMETPDTISFNELISGISQFGDMEDAKQILSIMPIPNSSSWNSIISGYVNRGQASEALEIFSKMQMEDVRMDHFTFSSILSGVAGLSALTWGMLIHCSTIKCGLDTTIVVGSALIDMYSKCGHVRIAESIFHLLPRKNTITWNAMISGFAHNGESITVIQLFEIFKKVSDLKPDGLTFLNVLLACWHSQMPLEIATRYFESMIRDYGIDPTAEHCCSMIRLMGLEGEVWKAGRMIYELGFGNCVSVWRALLGACGVCGDLSVAEIAAAKVMELEGDNEFVYVMMSNMYACKGRWSNTSVVRDIMANRGVRKEVGCSWIELGNAISP